MTKMAFLLAGVLTLSAVRGWAQVPAGAPAGATGICKDGTYSTAVSKSGACRGHKGVQTWYATAPAKPDAPAYPAPTSSTTPPAALPAPTPSAAAASAPAPTPANAPAASAPATSGKRLSPAQAAAARTAAPGGGPGLVWLNTGVNVYHCNGDAYYGKTKAGAYMSEADATAKGGRPAGGKVCTGK
jgi:hypothetical protein